MNNISTYLDIIIFAVIAVVLLLRLRSVFGQRGDQDPPGLQLPLNKDKKDDKVKLKDVSGIAGIANTAQLTNSVQRQSAAAIAQNIAERWAQNLPNYALVSNATTHNVLIQFPAFDPSFRPDDFLEKARKAFVLVVQAFSEGNKNSLDFLLSSKLKQVFSAQIDAREAAKETNHTQFHGIVSAIISDADLDGSVARVTVDFVAEQSITRKTADGDFIGHFDGSRLTTRDRWVFIRDLKDPSPSWVLENTLAHEE